MRAIQCRNAFFLLIAGAQCAAFAAAWPTHKGSIRRAGVSCEKLKLPLHIAWTHTAAHAPAPAWPAPANLNFATGQLLENAMTYDRCYHPVVSRGRLYYGSSSDDTVYCVDAATGAVLWSFVTGAPVRIPPVVSGDSLFAGSDDGFLYALDAASGKLLWRYRGGPESSVHGRMFIGNGRMISRWPIRCGIVADNGTLYFTSGLFPVEGVFLHALDLSDGREIWKSRIDVSAQGHMLATGDALFITTGRNTPVSSFSRESGKKIENYGKTKSWGKNLTGGSSSILIDDHLITGPSEGRQSQIFTLREPSAQLATFDAIGIIANEQSIYTVTPIYSEGEVYQIKSLDRAATQSSAWKKPVSAWSIDVKRPYALLLDAGTLYAGYDGFLCAYALDSGAERWRQALQGAVCGLALSDGALYAATDAGVLYCLRSDPAKQPGLSRAGSAPARELLALPESVRSALAQSGAGAGPGFCLVVDAVDGALALAAAASTGCRVIAVSSDPAATVKLRERFAKAGIYGSRVVVHDHPSAELPYPPCFADIIMSEAAFLQGTLPAAPERLLQFLRPHGGVLLLALPAQSGGAQKLEPWGVRCFKGWNVARTEDWAIGVFRRPALDGAGEWTHQYADPGGTSCSGDTLVSSEMDIQWFGEPGPVGMVDRHYRNVPPLYKGGRLFVPGNEVIYAVNAYNGSLLWKKPVPGSRRTGAFLDAGSMAVDDTALYVARGAECLALDAASGEQAKSYSVPDLKEGGAADWGFVGIAGETLIGSSCLPGSSHSVLSRDANKLLWQLGMPVVTSVNLFALDKATSSNRWTYCGGRILNTGIVFDSRMIFFAEVSGSAAATNAAGRMKVSELFAEGVHELVALSITTGGEIFRVKLPSESFTEPVYLQTAGGTLLLSGCKPEKNALRYSYFAYDAGTGALRWSASHVTFHKYANDGHGQQNRHPVIMGSTVYAWPYAYTLDEGRKIEDWTMDRRGHGCGGVSASSDNLFWRGGNPWTIAPRSGESARRLTQITRPGCWINIIPAGGLIMIPESSAGCTCGYSIQTSLTFGPRLERP
jgi:outer membrane protein assembly factor BamB